MHALSKKNKKTSGVKISVIHVMLKLTISENCHHESVKIIEILTSKVFNRFSNVKHDSCISALSCMLHYPYFL